MIGDGKKYHYLAVTNLSGLLQGNSSNHNSYTTKNKIKEHEEICNNHNSCCIEMPEWASKILKHNPGEKSLKARLVFFLDLECVLKKLQSTQYNSKSLKKPSGWSLYTKSSYDKKEDRLDYYRRKDCIEKLCKKL